MTSKAFIVAFLFLGLTGTGANLQTADAAGREKVVLPYDLGEPSIQLATHFQKRGDYTTAVLLYEAILQRNPSDERAIKSMLECHEALAKKELEEKSKEVQRPKPAEDDSLTDLPELIPADRANAQHQVGSPSTPTL